MIFNLSTVTVSLRYLQYTEVMGLQELLLFGMQFLLLFKSF